MAEESAPPERTRSVRAGPRTRGGAGWEWWKFVSRIQYAVEERYDQSLRLLFLGPHAVVRGSGHYFVVVLVLTSPLCTSTLFTFLTSLSMYRHFHEHEHRIDEQRDPPGEEPEEVEEHRDHRRASEEDSLAQGNAQNFSGIPGVGGYEPPESEEYENGDGTHRKKDRGEERGEGLLGGGERAHAKKDYEEGGCREKCGKADAEEQRTHTTSRLGEDVLTAKCVRIFLTLGQTLRGTGAASRESVERMNDGIRMDGEDATPLLEWRKSSLRRGRP